jgi:hypothetical protein
MDADRLAFVVLAMMGKQGGEKDLELAGCRRSVQEL